MRKTYFVQCHFIEPLYGLVAEMEGRWKADRFLNEYGFSHFSEIESSTYMPKHIQLDMCEQARVITNDPLFGLRLAQSLPFSALGIYGEYMASAPNLGQMFQRAAKASQYYESGSKLMLAVGETVTRLSYRRLLDLNGRCHVLDLCVISRGLQICRFVLGPEWVPISIELPGRAPHETQQLEGVLGAPVLYGRSDCGITLKTEDLEHPNPHYPGAADDVTMGDIIRLVRSQPPRNRIQEILCTIRSNLIRGVIDIESATKELRMSTRSFQRELTEMGQSFRDIVSQCRKERAIELLNQPEYAITDIAIRTCYSDPANFTRSFKRWTGVSPQRYRQELARKNP